MSAEATSRVFLDTNVLLYALASNDWREARAYKLLAQGGLVSVQVLNEFVNVTRRKLKLGWGEVQRLLEAVHFLCGPIQPLAAEAHNEALAIAIQYGFSIYDSSIIASALLAGCETLYSEDMQDGQRIEYLTIRNPFSDLLNAGA
jgi:predicted nucleic acid-binding protein